MTRITSVALNGVVTVSYSGTLAEERAERIADIKTAADARLVAGCTYAGHPLQCDDVSIGRMSAVGGLVANGLSLPPDFAWRMGDDVLVPMDKAGFLGMSATAFGFVQQVLADKWTAIAAVQAAPTPAAVWAVVF